MKGRQTMGWSNGYERSILKVQFVELWALKETRQDAPILLTSIEESYLNLILLKTKQSEHKHWASWYVPEEGD